MFFFHIPPYLYGHLAQATVSGTAVIPGSEVDDAYRSWAEAMTNYASQGVVQGTHAEKAITFWIVVRLPKENFSESLDFHEKIPMLVPVEGQGILIGLAKTAKEMDEMVSHFPERYVYLTYKIRLEGQESWRTLLEFLGEHNMIERDMG